MSRLILLDHAARSVRPEIWGALWVAGVAASLWATGARRGGRWSRAGSGLGVFLVSSSLGIAWAYLHGAAVWVPSVCALLAGSTLVWWVIVGRTCDSTLPTAPADSIPPAARVLALLVLVLAVVMSYRLTSYSGTLLTWEPSVIEGFGTALRDRVSLPAFAAERLLWQEGLVSSSSDSLLFGVPVYALWLACGPSLWALRAVALVWALVAVVGAYLLAHELGGRWHGLTAAGILATNALLFCYGRNGVSLAATLAAVEFAAWLVVRQAGPTPRSPWELALAGVCCAAATLGYSPARPVVVVLLGLVVAWAAWRWRPFTHRHAIGAAAFAGVVASMVACQAVGAHLGRFHHARGEQLLNILTHPDYTFEFLGYRLPGEKPTLAEGTSIALQVLRHTLPQYSEILTPGPRFEGLAEQAVASDPPALPLLPAPLFPFAVLGLIQAARGWRRPGHSLALSWFAVGSVTVLLTTRADVHRMWLLVVPLTLWATQGLELCWRLVVATGWAASTRRLAAIGLWILLSVTAVVYSFPFAPESPGIATVVTRELERIAGPVRFGGQFDHREQGAIELYLLRRFVRDPRSSPPQLPEELLESLAAGPPSRESLAKLRLEVRRATVVLGPAEAFSPAVGCLAAEGFPVAPAGEKEVRLWRLDRHERPPDPAVLEPPPGPEVPLTSLQPTAIAFGFAPPRIDQAWAGGPIRLAGVTSERGLGMHAPCSVTFPVPDDAAVFRVRVGLDDSAAACDRGQVMVSLQADDGVLLYESDLIDRLTPPLVVVVPVAGRRLLTLEADEGGNGRDCDHVSWADPAFILKAP
ncbi:MAG TPA: NPCBM/NEW2 domain-containing protein [Thermoanaerobaculaceae bacterium]|nr:NPCBM/NEW2 domain-containing protein [Thermoanaerobaculaceae bacterium]